MIECDMGKDYGQIDEWSGLVIRPNEEDRFWYGHSLPPRYEPRTGDMRGVWKKGRSERLVGALMKGPKESMAGYHRRLKEIVEFAEVFGEEHPADFDKHLLEYLAD